jgi:hypothetical protein
MLPASASVTLAPARGGKIQNTARKDLRGSGGNPADSDGVAGS